MRDVPAMVYWFGGHGSGSDQTAYSNPDNWYGTSYGQLPTSGDHLVFDRQWIAGDPMNPFSMGHYESIDCDGLSGTFAGMTVEDTYEGTITLSDALVVETLYVYGGTIDQPDEGDDITATDMFYWTGGTINSTSNVANVNIDGILTAYIGPVLGGSVELGSNLTIKNGTWASMGEGTLSILNDGLLITIADDSALFVSPGAGKEVEIDLANGVTEKPILFIDSGCVEVQDGAIFTLDGFVENFDRVTLFADSTFCMTGTINDPLAYQQFSGRTELYGESNLICLNIVYFWGGDLMTICNGTSSSATITASSLDFAGDNIYIGVNNYPPHIYGSLLVDGDVNWLAGTFHP